MARAVAAAGRHGTALIIVAARPGGRFGRRRGDAVSDVVTPPANTLMNARPGDQRAGRGRVSRRGWGSPRLGEGRRKPASRPADLWNGADDGSPHRAGRDGAGRPWRGVGESCPACRARPRRFVDRRLRADEGSTR